MASQTSSRDDWKLKAIHEQFDVFDDLRGRNSYCIIQDTFLTEAIVSSVVSQHLRLNGVGDTCMSTLQIIKRVQNAAVVVCKAKNEIAFELSFAVIVTDEIKRPQGLCKMPIFVVTVGNCSIFIDVDSKVFRSWSAFLQENSLPACKFCFPVDGRYNFGGSLKIDFAYSPAAAQSLAMPTMFENIVGRLISNVQVAASCLIQVAPVCLSIVTELTPVALKFIKKMNAMKAPILRLGSLISDVTNNRQHLRKVIVPASKILIKIFKCFVTAVQTSWPDVKRVLSKAYDQLTDMFPEFYASASPLSQLDFLALTESVDSEAVVIEDEAEEKVRAATKHTSIPGCYDHDNRAYRQQIFSSSITECALNYSGGERPLRKITTDMLTVTQQIGDHHKGMELHDYKCIFESVTFIVFAEYKDKIDFYTKAVNAARQSCINGKFDIHKFNRSLGITGNPREHFMQEVLKSTAKSLQGQFKVTAKINEITNNSKIMLIPLWKKHSDDDHDGVYRCIGVRGNGEFSTQALLSVLKEKCKNLDVENTTCTTLEEVTAICSDKFTVAFTQKVNEENTSEGFLYFDSI